MALAKKVSRGKLKKRWIQIVAPKLFNNQIIGETHIYDPNAAVGKTVPVNLMNLTGNMKNQNISMKFLVNSVSGEKASTEVIGFTMSPSSIKRMIRRGKDKLDQSFVVETADNKKLRIKTIIVTRSSTNISKTSALRRLNEENLKKAVKKMTYDNLISELVMHKLQSILRKQLSKIYPLKVCEIKFLGLEKEKKHFEEKPKEAPKEEKPKKEKPKKEKKAKEEKPAETKPAEEPKEAPVEEKSVEEKKE